jgi:hypothetical protein
VFDEVWTRTSRPLPRWAAVISGVPSSSVARVAAARPGPGSASTCRLTRASWGTVSPAKGPAASKGASLSGSCQESAPPSIRSPARSGTGTKSSPLAASRGPAKRSTTPPASIQAWSFARCSGSTRPVSGRTSSERGPPPTRSATEPSRISAWGLSALAMK